MSDKEKKKPTYEAPTVIPLGEIAQGIGANCQPGTGAGGGCANGPSAAQNCKEGFGANACAPGSPGN